jgi:hypothetical protein
VKEEQAAKLSSHSKQHEVCLGLSHSHMVLPVPLQLTPSFATNVCSIQYQLHFEFVTRYRYRIESLLHYWSGAFIFVLKP